MKTRAAALLLLASCGQDARAPADTMEVVRVVRDLLAEPPEWETVHARADGGPAIEVISPSVNGSVDGADMPALLLAPPAEVRFALAGELAPVRLVSRCGVDQLTFRELSRDIPEATIVFELLVDGRSRARQTIHLVRGGHADNVWVDLGGARGVDITSAATITLRTEARLPDGSAIDPPIAVRAGFGGLRLERTQTRARTSSSAAEPNIVLVVMDTLRADRLSAYGYPLRTSPHLEELASRGVLFEECQSTASWTWPATASILTGLTPMEHGLNGEGSSYLVDQVMTLAESMQSAGLTTAAWSGNPIVTPRRNFDQGFEEFHAAPAGFRKSGEFFEEVRTFLRTHVGTRFFLYLHLADPHNPLVPMEEGAQLFASAVPREFKKRVDDLRARHTQPSEVDDDERRWSGALYDACVWSGDHWLGELLGEIDALGLTDKTVIAFTSDHGEELFERGALGHGQSLHRELVHVPLVVTGPGVPPAERRKKLLSSRMIGPMLAGLAGVALTNGDSARARLLHDERGEDFVLFSTTKGAWKGKDGVRIVGLTDGEWKLDLALEDSSPGQDVELFHVSEDPLELTDVSASHPAETARLRELLLERLKAFEARRIGTDFRAGGATLFMLRQLGYGGDER